MVKFLSLSIRKLGVFYDKKLKLCYFSKTKKLVYRLGIVLYIEVYIKSIQKLNIQSHKVLFISKKNVKIRQGTG